MRDRRSHRIAPSGHYLEDVLRPVVAETRDADGALVDVTLAPLPPDCIAVHPPDGFQWPRWDGAAWVDAGVPFTVDPATGSPILPPE